MIRIISAVCALLWLTAVPVFAAPAAEAAQTSPETGALEEPWPNGAAGEPAAGSELKEGRSGDVIADNGLLYQALDDGTLSCVGLAEENRTPEIVAIPDTVQGMSVSEIGASAFEDEDTLITVQVPGSVRAIRASAFEHCNNLRDLRLPREMDVIETRAFYMCGLLEDFDLPSGITRIADETFFACDRLNVVRIPEGVTEIGRHAYFSNMYLHTVQLPTTLSELGDWCFGACESLKTINIPPSLTRIGKGAFNYCWLLPAPTLPEGLTAIEDQAFEGCAGFTNIDIPTTVRTIGAGAFESCTELREVNIVGSVASVGARAFAWCMKLSGIFFPDGLLTIGNQAFEGITLTADLPGSLVSIGNYAFDTEGSTIVFEGSPALWSRVMVGGGNAGIERVEYAVPDDPGMSYEPRLAAGTDLKLSVVPGTSAQALTGLEAGREAPETRSVQDAFELSAGESMRVLSPSGEVLTDDAPCGTGAVVEFANEDGQTVERVFVVVKGDLLGSGRISIAQLVCMANGLLDQNALSALELMAGDFNNSGTLDIGDLVAEARLLAG